jgi:PAS domain S-box-containing protein
MSPIEKKACDPVPGETCDAVASPSQFLLKLSDVLRPLADPAEIQERAAQLLGKYLKASRVGYAEDEGDGESVSVTRHYANGAPGVHGTYRYSDFGAAQLIELRAGRTVVRPDIANDPLLSPEEKQAHAVLQLGATIYVPLVKEGRLAAVLFAHYREAHKFNADEITLVQEVAERTWAAVWRARAESELWHAETRYRTLFEAMYEGFALCELVRNEARLAVDFRWLFCNAALERLTGLRRDDVINHSASEVIQIDYRWWVDKYASVVESGMPSRFEHGIASLRRLWDLTAVPCGGDRFAVLYNDITELRHAEENTNLLAAIVESSDDAIVSKNLDSIILSWNRGAERLFGYTAAEAVGKSIALIIPPDRLDEEPIILERLRRGERVDHFETMRVRKDGKPLHVSLTISPVKDGAGRIVGASKIARDITERVYHEKALREANTLLKRANADLQHFAHSASHDLQEPLRMVTAYSQLLQKKFGGQMGEEGDQFIDYIVLGAKRMENLLDSLRAYTHISTAEYETPDEIDACEALNKALLNLEIAIKDTIASITVSALPRVRMERFQLEQVFQNLIGNALAYRSNEAPRVFVAAERHGEEWLFSVQDNGIGIEAEDKEEIFGLFKRLHNSSKHAGSGMGLAICRRIVERAGGRIWVESEFGKGSTFYFSVPESRA